MPMSETASTVLFYIFLAALLGMIISNIILVRETGRRLAIFLTSVVLPLVLFLLYYYYEAPKIKDTRELSRDTALLLLKMDLITYFLVVVFVIHAVILVFQAFRKGVGKKKNGREKS